MSTRHTTTKSILLLFLFQETGLLVCSRLSFRKVLDSTFLQFLDQRIFRFDFSPVWGPNALGPFLVCPFFGSGTKDYSLGSICSGLRTKYYSFGSISSLNKGLPWPHFLSDFYQTFMGTFLVKPKAITLGACSNFLPVSRSKPKALAQFLV